jgi:hypothetical protein
MGVWGAGLYSGDFAMDLRSSIGAVVRLPFDEDRLVDILCETEPAVANNPEDSDHSIFWLVLADQFAKRAILTQRLRDKALAIIYASSDIRAQEALGARPADLKKRREMLDELRNRIMAQPPTNKKRTILKNPQPLLMEIGDVFVYPTFAGHCINPYFASKELDNKYPANIYGSKVWKQDGWAACVIVDSGRVFDFLAWYRPLTVPAATVAKPDLATSRAGDVRWELENPGTCSAVHFKRLELEKLGAFALDRGKIQQAFPGMKPGKSAAINDISIANKLNVSAGATRPSTPPRPRFRTAPTILGIDQILAS